MSERRVELRQVLTEVRRRWTRRTWLGAWALGASVAAVLLLAGWATTRLLATNGMPLALTLAFVSLAAIAGCARALWPLRRTPTDRQLARFIEERSGGLDDVVATAVAYGERPDASPRMREMLAADAVAALSGIEIDTLVSRESIRGAFLRAVAATAVLALAVALMAPAVSRAGRVTLAYLFPARIDIEVTPGSAKLKAGDPLTIAVTLPGSDGALVPTLRIGSGDKAQTVRMERDDQNRFLVTLKDLKASFAYSVTAARTQSPEYAITVVRPPRVERIDLTFDYPQGLGLSSRTEEDSGDIYGPTGTKVRLKITADKPIANAHLALADGTRVPLDGQSQVLDGALTIEDDGSYRVALVDTDGLESAGDTEYFIRTLLDRPPDVRILRPGGDKQVTPLEEVVVEARADDDFGIASFELVFQSAAGKEKTVALPTTRGELTASASRTLFLEDLGVAPGDFVTYYARARDVGRGRRGSEARSDIFFLEVKPFEEEFVAAQSQTMAMGGGGSGLQDLAEAQKEIIVATWKIDARARRARDGRSEQDIRAVGKAQSELKTRAEQASGALAGGPDPRRRRGAGQRPGMSATSEDPMAKAVDAMTRAVGRLDDLKTADALPHEMEALNQLLKAEAEVRRRQVARQQQAGGGGGSNRQGPDLSTLFDQELRKRQETNYETPTSSETREEEKPQEDPLEKVRELARRQAALNREQQDLARNREQVEEEELKRQLERLTREQNELRQQAEQLAQQLQSQQRQEQSSSSEQKPGQQGQQASGQQGQGGRSQQASGRRLREISEEMRDAATDLRRQDPKQASARGSRALDRLRELEQQMQGSQPDERRRAVGDLQLETRQLADAERRLASEAARTAPGTPGQDARRRLAGEQDRLADRVERLAESARRLAQGSPGSRDDQQAIGEAARELERQRLAERMRQAAEALRQGARGEDASGQPQGGADKAEGQTGGGTEAQAQGPGGRSNDREGEALAKALDGIADRLGAAAGAESADARRLSDQLSRTQELRDRVSELQRSIEELRRQGQQPEPGASQGQGQRQQAQASPNGQQQGPAEQSGQQQGQGGQQSQQAQGGQPGPEGREGAAGQQGGADGGRAGRVGQLQREIGQRMREAERLADQVRRDNPGAMPGPQTPESWWPSISAPGTEAFKQDFARWESLKQNLLVALEQVETNVSGKLRDRENRERLNAGRHEAAPESYREQVDRYYRSLAAPRRSPQE